MGVCYHDESGNADGKTTIIRQGQVCITPLKPMELRETELIPDNGSFMRILSGDLKHTTL